MAEKKQFEVLDTPLEGSNLIEASAGTGKTYSIAILVLRLLLEKKVDISRILMVTFTNKAVGELADRVRRFIKKGLDYIESRDVEVESEIAVIIDRSTKKDGKENVENLLKIALFKLDEAPIQTIDSFAGECLNTYAFETGRQFGQELIKDTSDIVRSFVEKFWREEITDINDEEYEEVKSYLTLDMFQKMVFNTLDGKEFYYCDEACKKIEVEDKNFREIWEENLEEYQQRIDGLDVKLKGVGPATIAGVKEEFEDLYKFKECIQLKRKKVYNILINHLFQEEIKFYRDWQTEWDHPAHEIFNSCAKAVVSEVENYLQENNLITYKQILDKLNEKVKSNSQLREILSDRYDAVFIDEFQDTNKTQFEIYDHAFGEKNLLFYIGDPKQSIYGFRGADLFSYDEAAKTVDVIYTMKENFRSSHKMVEAQNSFFRPKKDFDAFSTNARVNEEDDVLDIKYIPVSAKGENKAAVGIEDNKGNILAPIKIFNGENSGSIPEHTVDLIKNLLSESFSLNGEEIQASNIGILVRKGWQGEEIKRSLSAEGIRAITVNETTIFSTPEAKSVNYLLKAVETPTWGNLNRAMLTEFTSLKTQDLLDLDENSLAEDFRKYKDLWINSGVYAVIRKFMDDYGVVHTLMSGGNENGLRHLSNINQLAEVLQQAELHRELGPSGLIKYLTRQISSPDAEGDEYEQRIESDEDAVRIYNIHKAKGLEFPIVIAPYLDLDDEKEYQFNSFRDPADKKYKFYHQELRPDVARKHYVLQNTQENRRLIYVTLTRAQFNCFIFKTGRNSSLSSFVEELKENSNPLLIEISPFDLSSEAVPRKSGDEKEVERKALASQGTILKDRNWRKMSFSAISAKGAKSSKENTKGKDEGI